MADYQPLIQRAVEGLAEPKAAARRDVYERARTALAAFGTHVGPPGLPPEHPADREPDVRTHRFGDPA